MNNKKNPSFGHANQEELETGQMLNNGQYRIKGVLDRGGSAIVYLAFDTKLDKSVAIKEFMPAGLGKRDGKADVLPQDPQSERDFNNQLRAFRYESKILALFKHRSIVLVHNAFDENKTAYFVMELCEGHCLRDKLDQVGKISELTVRKLIERLIPAIKKLHEEQVIHRDIKPSNIGLDKKGWPILIDFGAARHIAKAVDGTISVSYTPGYACKEHYSGESLKPMFDIYSLAATAYECLTGIKPHSAQGHNGKNAFKPLAEHFSRTSLFLKSIDQALSTNPANRPKTLDEWVNSWGPVGNSDLTIVRSSIKRHEAEPILPSETLPLGPKAPEPIAQSKLEPKPDPEPLLKPSTKPSRWRFYALAQLPLAIAVTAGLYYHLDQLNNGLKADIKAWQAADKANSTVAYKHYLESQPNPQFRIQAQQRIEQLEIDKTKLALTINRLPADAKVRILNIKPKYYDGIRLVPGEYKIEVTRTGFNSVTRLIELNEENTRFDFALSKTYKIDDGLTFTMQTIPGGEFEMGAKNGDENERNTHRVKIGSFRMMQTEVTYDLWDACVQEGACHKSPVHHTNGRKKHPVVDVSYFDVVDQFIPWLNSKLKDKTGHPFSLPTEAQWEYAARAGNPDKTYFSWGNKITEKWARYGYDTDKRIDQMYTQPVGKSQVNGFGLFDMHGNAYEWVEACYQKHYDKTRSNGLYREVIEDCDCQVKRGGSWKSPWWRLRSSSRGCSDPTKNEGSQIGFRLVQAN